MNQATSRRTYTSFTDPDYLFPGTTSTPLFSGNKVTVEYAPGGGISDPDYVFGGLSITDPVTGNKVFIKKGSMSYVHGGLARNDSGDATITGNTVTINGGSVGGSVFGGYAYSDSGSATASGNTITLSGVPTLDATVTVYGGLVNDETILDVGGDVTLSGNNTVGLFLDGGFTNLTALTTGEIIRLTNSGTISATAHIGTTLTYQYDFNIAANETDGELQVTLGTVGGASITQYQEGDHVIFNTPGAANVNNASGRDYTFTGDPVVGNTLVKGGAGTLTLANTHAYQGGTIGGNLNAAGGLLNFYLPSGFAAGGTLLNVAGNANIAGSTVNVGVLGSSSPLKTGDAVTLLSAFTLTGAPANNVTGGKLLFGSTLVYDFDLRAEGNALLATVRDSAVTPPAPPVTPVDPPVTPPPCPRKRAWLYPERRNVVNLSRFPPFPQ
jgi:autotransporter-associated beta strand protein